MHKDNAVLRCLNAVGSNACRSAVIAAMMISLAPATALAANATTETGSEATNNAPISAQSNETEAASNTDYTYDLSKIADGTYTGSATASESDPLNKDDEWDAPSYEVSVTVTVASGKITKVEVADYDSLGDNDWDRMNRAVNGYSNRGKTYAGVVSQIETAGSTSGVDTVTTATITSNAILEATNSALQAAYDDQNKTPVPDPDPDPTPVEDEYTYGYAALNWAEYWAAEGVQNATDTSSSEELDSKGETDKGGYDVVTRATTNHGLHRGSYQCTTTIYCSDGTSYGIASWASDGKSFTSTDGKTIGYSRGTLTTEDGATHTLAHYEVSGLKYVPVAVKTSELEDFKKTHTFVANGETLTGGYGENKLSAYSVTAEVDANTYGLKTATKNGSSFSFSKASTAGTTSGIKDQSLKTATGIEPSVHAADGSYGEFLRVDLNGNYGDLGANMQAVTWTYYGNDSTRSKAVATFGTKFAADNWMHKSMGIQLGLTHSQRCQLPDGSDGTGYWTITVHALGYSDYSWDFEATSENIAVDKPATGANVDTLQELYDEAAAKLEGNYSADSWSSFVTERDETKDLLDSKGEPTEVKDSKGNVSYEYQAITNAAVLTQTQHLQAALNDLVRTAPAAGDYVLMNIPYDEFYAAETTDNSVAVDVFTSATKNKVRTGSLAGGSYHKDATGDEISGITYVVKVTEDAAEKIDWSKYAQVTDGSSVDVTVTNRGQTSTTTYKGKEALFEADTYSYYVLSSDAQANYKELTVDADGKLSFSALKGDVKSGAATVKSFTTESSYGDYQLNLGDDVKTTIGADATVYAVVVNTTDGTGYGMRHLENIWRTTELAWCTGFTSAVHNCPTSSEHYKSMMGKTIDSVTYYTSNGVYKLDIDNTYVPVKSADSKLSVSAEADATEASVEASLPFQNVTYTLDGETVEVKDGKLDISSLKPGSHTLVAKDADGKYADVKATFTTSTSKAVAQIKDNAVAKADDAGDDDFSNYLGNISKVTVNGKSYSATGRGSVAIVNKDGSINTEVTSNNAKVFDGYGDYSIEIESTGYPALSGTVTLEADKTSLAEAIEKAEAQTTDGYTAASVKDFQDALAAAKEVAANKKASDDEVAQAASKLTAAQAALKLLASDDAKVEIKAEIKTSENLSESDYTADSWKAYQAALEKAKKVEANEDASEDEVKAATEELAAARSALKKASKSSGTTDKANGSSAASANAAKKSSIPDTGDNTSVVVAGFASAGAAIVALGAALRRRMQR